MKKLEDLRRFYELNVACGDIGEAEQARMLAMIAAAEEVAERELAAA